MFSSSLIVVYVTQMLTAMVNAHETRSQPGQSNFDALVNHGIIKPASDFDQNVNVCYDGGDEHLFRDVHDITVNPRSDSVLSLDVVYLANMKLTIS